MNSRLKYLSNYLFSSSFAFWAIPGAYVINKLTNKEIFSNLEALVPSQSESVIIIVAIVIGILLAFWGFSISPKDK